jgi:hypothetical protein
MSTMLLQQELMEPEPQRRLIVREGMTAHWGVDPSTLRVAIACGNRVMTQSFPRTEGLARLSDIYDATLEFVTDLLIVWPAPGFVLVEQPSGKTINLELTYAVGVIICAVQQALEERVGGVRVETVVSSSWKRLACGRGNLYKPKKGDDWEYGVLLWARENGYEGSSWDEADALGIAEAARRTVTLEAR